MDKQKRVIYTLTDLEHGSARMATNVKALHPVHRIKVGDVVRFDIPRSMQVGPYFLNASTWRKVEEVTERFIIATALDKITKGLPQAFNKAHLVDIEWRQDTERGYTRSSQPFRSDEYSAL